MGSSLDWFSAQVVFSSHRDGARMGLKRRLEMKIRKGPFTSRFYFTEVSLNTYLENPRFVIFGALFHTKTSQPVFADTAKF